MTGKEWEQFMEALEKAQSGDKEALNFVCKTIDTKLKLAIMVRLWAAGIPTEEIEDRYQDVLVRIIEKLKQLKEVKAFSKWLKRIERSVAKKHRPRYQQFSLSVPEVVPTTRPRIIGTKTIFIEGKPHVVSVFEPKLSEELNFERQSLCVPLGNSIIESENLSSCPNHERAFDTMKALNALPKLWTLVLSLRFEHGYSCTETAVLLGRSKKTIYRICQKPRRRIRRALSGYNPVYKPDSK